MQALEKILRSAVLMALMLFFTTTPTPIPKAFAVKVLVVVNDQPITDFDVRQRMKLYDVLGMRGGSTALKRKRALQSLVDEAVLFAEARRRNMVPDDIQVESAIKSMANKMGGMEKLRAALRRKGLGMSHLRNYVRAQMIFRAIAARAGRKMQVKVSEAEVERRLKKILSDPRLKPITIWTLRRVELPVDDVSPVMRQQLMMARAVEAQQIMRRYKGCKSLRKAISGIFNVRVSKPLQADPRRLPPPLKKALKKAGTRRLIGPIAAPKAVQLIAFCGKRSIRPKIPEKGKLRQQLRAAIQQEKIQRQVDNFMKPLRRKAVIEWRTKKPF